MNSIKQMIVVAVLVGVQAYALSAWASLGYMRISLIENEVYIKTPEVGEWGYGAINTPLDVGDEVWVPQGGRAELQLNTGTYIRLDGGTALQILSMDQDSSQMYLSQGAAYIYYDAPRNSIIQVDTPDASTRAFDRAIFSLSISAYSTEVGVYKGYVLTENQLGEIRVNAGNMVSLGPDTNGEIASIGYLGEWEGWNQARDERLYEGMASESVRYLPSELRTYSSDLDYHGSWVHDYDYGYVWTPRTHIDSSWTPYRHGRWLWRHGDYIWLPYEPWGWVPYHYGRWAFIGNIGWCWVPPRPGAVYWGPGYVGWIRTVDYVGWVPLAPGEIYYGRGYYGRDSVNITNVHINEINITNIYQNVTVSNGPVIVGQNAFLSGSQDGGIVDGNIRDRAFIRKNMIPGSPDIKPAKKSLFAVVKEIPKDRVPPRHAGNQPATELKKVRPLTREPRHSVFNPGSAPANLPMQKTDPGRIKGKEKPSIEKGRPVPRPQPVDPGRLPKGKVGPGQFQPDPQGRPVGPADKGVGPVERIKEPRPVRREPPVQRPQPVDPGRLPKGKVGPGQFQPDPQGRPTGPAEKGVGPVERIKEPRPVRREPPVQRPQPVDPGRLPKGKVGPGQFQPDLQGRPMSPAEKGVGPTERIKQPRPVPREPRSQQPPPMGTGSKRDGQGIQIQPAQPVRPPAQVQPARPQKSSGVKQSGEEAQPEVPQYWPGQKGQYGLEKYQRNVPPNSQKNIKEKNIGR
ncbi:MAG: DUF6600 domain-containing protein [Desulfobulbaceae bacterium]